MTRWIHDWRPEDPTFWATRGRRVAGRNLVFSILAEHLGFSVWLLWSAVVVSLPAAGFQFSLDQLLWLVALPNLVGAAIRLPYTAAVVRFGGRNWTVVSAALLLLPVGLLGWCVTRPGTPYWMFLLAAATAGVGGGNFASSMANISYFYPERRKGVALGVNAAGGNIGVAGVQLVVPAVVVVGVVGAPQAAGLYLQNAALIWVLPIVAAMCCAWLFMDNLVVARATLTDQLAVLRRRHTWVMSLLYIGTFGSFIGYSAALPLLISREFPGVAAGRYAFLGPLVGSLVRPIGGWLADRVGGAKVTAVTFVVMAAGAAGVVGALRLDSFAVFLGTFLVLFAASGIGNGSTYRMIPAIFRAEAVRRARANGVPPDDEAALAQGRHEAAAVIGLCSAVGAFGGFLIPRGLGMSIAQTGRIDAALVGFLAGYALCLVLTWWYYMRRRLLVRLAPSLAAAEV